jgi:hypothetical protein
MPYARRIACTAAQSKRTFRKPPREKPACAPVGRGLLFAPIAEPKADVPGIQEKDLEVTLTGNRLTIAGKRDTEKEEQNERYYTYERSYGSFTRTFTLPDGADADKLDANLSNGVLSIVIPKKPELQPKKIDVKAPTPATKS